MVDRQYLVVGPDGIVRYISGVHELNVANLRAVIDEHLPLDEPTFEFTVDTTRYAFPSDDYPNGDAAFAFNGQVNNLLDIDQNLIYTLTPVYYPNEHRKSSVCTYQGCYVPGTGTLMYTVPYSAGQEDDEVIFEVYPELDTSGVLQPIEGDYILDVRVYAESAPGDYIEYRLTIDDLSVSVEERPRPLPESISLLSNYPNPFNPSTTVRFRVDQAGPVKVTVYDILGRNVAELVNTTLNAGSYSTFWEARNSNGVPLPSGSYWARLDTPTAHKMHRIVLLR